MIYLTRPVFEFDVDWSDAPAKTFSYDLREMDVGFGAEYFATLQQHIVQGYNLNLTLRNQAEIDALDEFLDDLTGRLQGFWLPVPFEAVQIVTADDATHFYIADQNLRSTFADQPDLYLLFTRAGETRAAKIAAVEVASNGRERVTLTTALATPATTADVVHRLHYVRLAKDDEEGQFLAEGIQARTLDVVELPHEYEAFETGEQPIWLYKLSCAVPVATSWHYTSFAAGVVSDNQLYSPFPMQHRGIAKSAKLDAEKLTIEAKYDVAHPFAMFLPLPLPKPMSIEVFEVALADVETRRTIFSGKVRLVEDEGERVVAQCDAWTAVLGRKVLGMMFQPGCNYDVFNPRTCKLQRWQFETTAEIVAIDNTALPPRVTLALDHPDSLQFGRWTTRNWFQDGFATGGFGTNFQVRQIVSSRYVVDELRIELNAPIDLDAGDQLTIVPGCSGTVARCKQLGNFDNFGGFHLMPEKNLSLQAMDAIVSQGGKK
jgi:hypothetical protein